MMLGDPMDLDEEDDEETLQLKLQEIQAQLRLKKLRKEKARAVQEPQGSFGQSFDTDNGRSSRPDSASTTRPGHRIKEIRRTDPAARPRSQPPPVEVPASPVRKAHPLPTETSPSRILLGIDKGLKGKDISLKRAPSLRRSSEDTGGSQGTGYLRSARNPGSFEEKQRPLSFSERLKAARDEETVRQETRDRAAKSRSTAFNVGRQEMEDYKSHATDILDEPSPRERDFTKEEILGIAPTNKSRVGLLQRSNTTSSARTSSFPAPSNAGPGSPDFHQAHESFTSTASEPQKASSSPSFEPYSCFHLNKRILPHQIVARAISGKTTYSLKDLLRQVKSPHWSLPDDVIDSVVFAVVASKSEPRHHKPTFDAETGKMKPSDRGKYMVITLVDLEYEIDLFLFNSGFERFWKLSTGTVVAILNPDIMPPPPGKQDTGRFSLTINSDADTILEIGVARDLGYCRSVKADGKLCNTWVNARRTEHCEFHTNAALAKTRGARNEINGGGSFGAENTRNKTTGRWASQEQKARAERREKIAEKHGELDWETRSRFFVSGGSRGASNADQEANLAETRERAEGLKRRLAAKEKERDIAKRLGEMGTGGMGGEYMRIAGSAAAPAPAARGTSSRASRFGGGSSSMAPPTAARFSPALKMPRIPLPGTHYGDSHQQQQQEAEERKTDARSLGLLAPRGSEPKIHLSPIKRKRQDSSNSSSFDAAYQPLPHRSATAAASRASHHHHTGSAGSSSSTNGGGGGGGFGWGTSLRDKLSRMRDGERLNLRNLALHAKTDSNSTSSSSGVGMGSGTGTTNMGAAAFAGAASAILGQHQQSAFRDKDRSPVRKKTRFVTDKGIREAGRESLPGGGSSGGGRDSNKPNVRPGILRAAAAAGLMRGREVVLDDEDEDMDELVVVR